MADQPGEQPDAQYEHYDWITLPPSQLPADQYPGSEYPSGQYPSGQSQIPWGYPAAPQAVQPVRPSRRRLMMMGAVGLVVLILIGALVNGLRTRSGGSASKVDVPSAPSIGSPTGPLLPSPTPPNGSSGGLGVDPSLPQVSCPTVRDDQSHLSYQCLIGTLSQGPPDSLLGLRISMVQEVEPGWVISEGSGNPKSVAGTTDPNTIDFHQAPTGSTPSSSPSASAAAPTLAAIRAEVRARAAKAVNSAYGSNPSSRVLADSSHIVSGKTGYLLQTEITINPAYRASTGLATKTERLWVIGVPTAAGISIFMMSIPDLRKDLWPRADATIATLRII